MKSSYKELRYVWTLLFCEELEMQTMSQILISLTWLKAAAITFVMIKCPNIYRPGGEQEVKGFSVAG